LSSDAISAEPGNVDKIGETNDYEIKTLRDPSSAVLDIVFVHGLTGSAYSTWLHEDSGKYWPRDLIKNDISDARVMTFGYNRDASHFWRQDGISNHAEILLRKLAIMKRKDVVGVLVSSPHPLTPSPSGRLLS
jgi:hypothetical protein